MKHLLAALAVFSSLLSCTPDPPPAPPPSIGGRLTSFTVTVLDRTISRASITWTEALNFVSYDTVKYKVTLNGRVVDSNLTRRDDILFNLSGDSAYLGRVWAYTKSGDTSSAGFVLDKVQEYIAINGSNHFAMHNLNSGVKMWHYGWNYGSNSSGAPTIVGDTVFFCNAYSSGNKLLAYNFKTGREIWTAFPYSGPPTNLAETTNPVYHDGKLYVASTSGFHAISSRNGLTLWSRSMVFSFNVSAPVIDNSKIFISSANTLRALDLNNGNLLWSFPIDMINDRLLCMNNLIVFGTKGKVYALNQATGSIVWERNFTTPSRTFDTYQEPPVFLDNTIITFVSGDGFYGLNPATGAIKWKEPRDYMNYTAMVKGNGKLFYVDYDREKIVALNPVTGAIHWEVDSRNCGTFVFAKNKLYCSTSLEVMTVLDAATGEFLKTVRFNFLGTSNQNFSLSINDSSYYQNTHSNFK